MTITSTTNKITATCNGAQTVFNYSFLVPTGSGFRLIKTVTATGEQSVISTAAYSVSGLGQPTGGTFTYNPSGTPVPAGNTLTFQRVMPETQQTSISNQGPYDPAVVESGMDWIVMQIQDINEKMNRCVKTNVVDGSSPSDLVPATQRENLALLFDGTGAPYAG